jgi:protein arginine N-methyltransferase 1
MTYDKSHQSTLNYHSTMLNDALRVDAYSHAILKTVGPGDVVVDLGCGTGVLSILACQAGAARVFAIEHGPIIEVARRVAEINGYQDRITFIQGLSTEIALPELCDVLVTETIGNIGFDEGIVGFANDARRRFLKPGARVVPEGLELFLVPVCSDLMYQPITAWENKIRGLDFSPGAVLSANSIHWVRLKQDMFLAPAQKTCQVHIGNGQDERLTGAMEFEFLESGCVHGLGGWFNARLIGDVSISNGPPFEWSSWANAFLPFPKPVKVAPADRLRVELKIGANGALWTWGWALDSLASDTKRNSGNFVLQSSFLGTYGKPGTVRDPSP